MATKYIVVRQDTLEGRQVDGTWGERSTAKEYSRKGAAMEAAAKAGDELGRLVTVQASLRSLVGR